MKILEDMKVELREEHRLKDGCDYAIVHKYNETRVLCDAVWVELITEIAKKHGVYIMDFYTYNGEEGDAMIRM